MAAADLGDGAFFRVVGVLDLFDHQPDAGAREAGEIADAIV
jgi:hypothetical protein